ncbi:MAG: HD domain-containing protein [Deltaproteobacteria bacterium]|nr:HD domain-containing protein [Deltaproteobacteria bacterium]
MSRGFNLKRHLSVDKELVIVFLLVLITGIIHFISNQRAFLNFFYLPVLLGAYFFGRRHGTLSGVLSVLMVFSLAYFVPDTFYYDTASESSVYKWVDVTTWAGFLIITGYAMGILYEKKEAYTKELKSTYQGIVTMLSIVIDSVDRHTYGHSYRVSRYAEKIANAAKLSDLEVEDIRIAALLHDLGKIGVSAEILHKIERLTEEEKKEIMGHTTKAVSLLEPLGGRILKILPLILNHHERYDGKGYHGLTDKTIPIGAKLIAVADVYDALTTDRPYRKTLSPIEGRNEIKKGSGTHFDPEIVRYFEQVFSQLEVK